MSREIVIEEAVIEAFEKAGWYQRKVMFVGVKGCPDRFLVRKGLCIFIEFKRPGGVLSGHQVRRIRELEAHGQEVWIIDDTEVGLNLCQRYTLLSDRQTAA